MEAKKPLYKNHFVSYSKIKGTGVISYKRNNLIPEDFKRTSDGFVFREAYEFRGLEVSIFLKIDSETPLEILDFPGTDFLRISGTDKHIGILVTVPDRALPYARTGKAGNIEYQVKVTGTASVIVHQSENLKTSVPGKRKTSLTKHLLKKKKQ